MTQDAVEKFKAVCKQQSPIKVYEPSITERNGCVFFLIRQDLERKLAILRDSTGKGLQLGFTAEESGRFESEGKILEYVICPCNHQNASMLRETFPFTGPQVMGLTPAIGMGDRIGLATPAHIQAVKQCGVFPVLAQQSIREMERTLRTPEEVLDDVSWAVFQEGYRGGFGADADHLKTVKDVDGTFKAGFTMYTIDPSDFVDNMADTYDLETLRESYGELPWEQLGCSREEHLKTYLGKRVDINLPEEVETLIFSEEALLRAAVKYSAAIAHAARMYRHLRWLFSGGEFDVEMSVDETEMPTSPLEHFFMVSELKRLGVLINGLAPRLVGRFEKAVDYKGSLWEFESSLHAHVSIAKAQGPYKLSIHSGSDKFSIYPVAGRLASDMVHLKTAGTSYLEALRVIARHDPALFREIVKYGLERFAEDRKSYDVSTDLSVIPDPHTVPDEDLGSVFLDENNARQLLHITYGSVLTARKSDGQWVFREQIRRILVENEEEHYKTVAEHMRRHIQSLWTQRTS